MTRNQTAKRPKSSLWPRDAPALKYTLKSRALHSQTVRKRTVRTSNGIAFRSAATRDDVEAAADMAAAVCWEA